MKEKERKEKKTMKGRYTNHRNTFITSNPQQPVWAQGDI
jgi:hypothetical protein